MPEISFPSSPTGKFLKDDKTFAEAGGEFTGTMDDIPNGVTYVKTENNFTDNASAKVAATSGIKQIEIDFGAIPIISKKFTITDAEVIGTSNKINAVVSYDTPTGGETNDAEWFENLNVMARAGVGEFFLYCSSRLIDLDGKVKINYIIG